MYLVQFVLDFPKLILIHVSKRSCTIPTLLWQVGAYCIFGSMNLQGMLLQELLLKKIVSPLQVIHLPQLAKWFHVLLTVKCFCLIPHDEKTLANYWERMMSYTMEQFFLLSVETNLGVHWFWFTLFCDWSRKLASLTRPVSCKTNNLVARVFPRLRRWACFHF